LLFQFNIKLAPRGCFVFQCVLQPKHEKQNHLARWSGLQL